MTSPRISLIANPENRRARFFGEACRRIGVPEPKIIPWRRFLAEPELELPADGILRIESPGEDFEVERALIMLGAGEDRVSAEGDLISAAEAGLLAEERGLIRYQCQWFRGWTKALERIAEQLRMRPDLRVMNAPADIRTMFDKMQSTDTLAAAGVPLPGFLGRPRGFDHLIALLDHADCHRAFVKLCHGSSASGVVAFERSRHRMKAITSATIGRSSAGISLRNSLRLNRYEQISDIRDLIDALARHNLIAERWFPKASINSHTFDLRIVVIGGVASHIVVRTSKSPITNLHLGNRRGDLDAVRQRLGSEGWQEVLRLAEHAAAAFPASLYLGADLMVGSSFNRFAVAEVNAFGDLLPGIVDSWGNDTYTVELRTALQRTV